MNNIKLWLLGAALIITSTVRAQSTNFVFEPQRPLPGQSVQITYNPAGTPLAGKKEVHAVVYAYNSYQWHTSDLNMTPAGDKFKSTLQLDNDAGMVTLKFVAGDSTDNNHDRSYTIMMLDPKVPAYDAPGAYAGWGLLRAERFGYGIPGYFKSPKLSDTAFYYWMNNEITRHPKEGSEAVAVPFTKGLYAYQGQSGIKRINNVIAFLSQRGGESNLMKVREIYGQVLGKKTAVDSLDEAMVKQFPHGNVAALRAYNKLNNERDVKKKIELSEQFLNDFPVANADARFDEENRILYSTVYQNIIILNIMQNKDYDILKKYASQLNYFSIINLYYKIIEIAHNRKDETDEKLYPYARLLIERMESLRDQKPAEYWYLSPAEWQQQWNKSIVNNMLITHVNLLKNTGHDDDALKYALYAQQTLKYKRANLNNDEVFLLNKKGQNAQVNDVLIKSMYENQSTPEMIEMLKANYIKQYKTEYGFDKYIESLKNAALSVASTAKMEMIKKDFPDWSMYDADNKLINFKDLRGKTIVMDFWATWCVPCKASFPGMKLAVEKYKNDPKVAFYFVDTEERTADYKAQVKKYIKDNNYPFHILFDNKVNGGAVTEEVYNRMCKAFGISGIPQKLVIDKNGKLRFIAIGYKGSASELADEMSAMIEMTKKAD